MKITITREQLRKALNNPSKTWLDMVCPNSIEIEVDESPFREEPTEPKEPQTVLMSPAIVHGCTTNLLFSDFNQAKRQYSSSKSWPLKIVIKNLIIKNLAFNGEGFGQEASGELFIEVPKEEK